MPKKFWLVLVASLIAAFLLPLGIDWLIIGNNFPSNISNSDWVGFLGGYVGSILGCAISLLGILWTINFTREQNRADRELQIRPYFDIRYIPSINKLVDGAGWLGYVMINEFDKNGADNQEVERGLLYLKNVGNGPATNIAVTVSVEDIQVDYKTKFNNQNAKVTSNSVRQGEEAAVLFILTNNRITPSKDDLTWNENGFADYNPVKFAMPSPYNIMITLCYNDLLGNVFTQTLRFHATYEMSYDRENGGIYCCNLHLTEKGVPQKK